MFKIKVLKAQLKHIKIKNYATLQNDAKITIPLSYQLFGQKLYTAPIVLVNHALTGNSNVAGKNGWWNSLIGNEKTIDTNKYTVVCFNIPGNGYDDFLINNYKDFSAKDIASIFLLGLKELKIQQLFAIIGGSLGGGIAWEMSVLNPVITQNLIPVASDWKATDWLIANCRIQELLLSESENAVHNARMHAMMCYRTPTSFKQKFQRSINEELQLFNVESWLLHHGKKLQERYQLSAYKLMNQLLKTINAIGNKNEIDVLKSIKAKIHIVAINTDLFFTANENKETYKSLIKHKKDVNYSEIKSIHGHDAFLIEYKQLSEILKPIFTQEI